MCLNSSIYCIVEKQKKGRHRLYISVESQCGLKGAAVTLPYLQSHTNFSVTLCQRNAIHCDPPISDEESRILRRYDHKIHHQVC